MTTGERIKAARKKAGMTQAELATKSSVAAISIHQYEAGKRHPQLEQVLRIAAALDVSVQDLEENLDPEDIKDAIIYGGPIGRVVENMQQLNLTGRQRVEAYSADMLQIAAYRENGPQPPQTATESTQTPQEGTDTTPAETPPQRPQEGTE